MYNVIFSTNFSLFWAICTLGITKLNTNDAPLLPLSLDRFPPNFTRTRFQVVARDTWFHFPEKFPLRDRILRKTVFLWYFRVPCLCPAYGSREMFCDAETLSIPSWTSHRFILPFAEGCTVFQLSTSERFPSPQYQQWRNLDAYISFKHTRYSPRGAAVGSPICSGILTTAHFLVNLCGCQCMPKLVKPKTSLVLTHLLVLFTTIIVSFFVSTLVR